MIIGYMFIGDALGENIIGFESFYAIKQVYNCKLHVFTNKGMQNLLAHCDFVDLVTDIDISIINQSFCDYLIISNSKTKFIRFALETNAKRIICATKPLSFVSYRCRTVPIYTFKKYRFLNEREILLAYVRRIDSKLYDEKIQHVDLNQSKVQLSQAHRELIDNFLESSKANIPNSLLSSPSDLHQNFNVKNKKRDKKTSYLIAVNPFNNACPYSLTLQGYFELILEIAKMPFCIPCVATYPQVHDFFIKNFESFKESLSSNEQIFLQKLIIFPNDSDLLNLAAFLERMDCVISPSTGTIHLACNLRIPTIAIYPKYDTRRWATHNKKYVFVQTPKLSITKEEELQARAQVIDMLAIMISNHEI